MVDVVLEGVEWIKQDSTLWEWKSNEYKDGISEELHGDEVFHAFDFAMMIDEEIEDADPDPLLRLKLIGVGLKEEIEDLKWRVPTKKELKHIKETHNVLSPDFDVWTSLEKLANEAGSDFFDFVCDETLNRN